MTELSPRARAACEALRSDGARADERERVRARLSALGLAMGVSATMASAAASAAASSAGATIAASSPASLPAAALTNVTGGATGFASGGAVATKSALIGVATASKLASVPVAVKAGLALLAVTSALSAPKLMQLTTEPARTAHVLSTHVPERTRLEKAAALRGEPLVTPLAGPAPVQVEPRTSVVAQPVRKPPSVAQSSARAPQESTLAAESALLASALSALRAGRSERAGELLKRHEETYGTHALLARERERMRRELSHLLR